MESRDGKPIVMDKYGKSGGVKLDNVHVGLQVINQADVAVNGRKVC